jgi:DNA-binding transcriptional MerR regulator
VLPISEPVPEAGSKAAEGAMIVSNVVQGAGDHHSDEIQMLPLELSNLDFVEVEPSASLNQSLEAIPDRMAFKIGTAAELVGVKTYVLRFWETEFEALRPKKSRKGQRAYSRRDIETAMIIKKLLYEDRFSIEGARARLRELRSKVKEERGAVHQLTESRSSALGELRSMKAELIRFRALLA